MKITRPEIILDAIQIKSLRIAKEICRALDVIEEVGGIHSTRITVKRPFICCDIDLDHLSETPMERLMQKMLRDIRKRQAKEEV